MYLSPVILKPYLNEEFYTLFATLHVIVLILCHPELNSVYNLYALELSKCFIEQCRLFWGDQFIVYNVYNIIHICETVKIFGPVDNFSCYWSENFIRHLKKLYRGSNFVLEQIVKRVSETNVMLGFDNNNSAKVQHLYNHTTPEINGLFLISPIVSSFKKLQLKSTFVSVYVPDNYIINKSNKILKIKFIVVCEDLSTYFIGNYFKTYEPIFLKPLNSLDYFNVSIVSNPSTHLSVLKFSDVHCKVMLLYLHGKNYVFPILHTHTDFS